MSESACRQFERKLAHFTAPTLLGIKCASLISISREEFDILPYAAAFNAKAEKSGLQMKIMCRCQKRLLVLLYRSKLLQKRLDDPAIQKFLRQYGYTNSTDMEACLAQLQRRIAEKPEFPHEIGIFLGYPLEDVNGFIMHRGENCKLCGCWKVYGNVEQARRTFSNYEKCRVFLCTKLSKGCSILQTLKIS